MLDLAFADPGPEWIAAAVVLWLGGAGWVTAVAAHLGLPEWRWFGLALSTGPVAWIRIYLRLRRRWARRRAEAASVDASSGMRP